MADSPIPINRCSLCPPCPISERCNDNSNKTPAQKCRQPEPCKDQVDILHDSPPLVASKGSDVLLKDIESLTSRMEATPPGLTSLDATAGYTRQPRLGEINVCASWCSWCRSFHSWSQSRDYFLASSGPFSSGFFCRRRRRFAPFEIFALFRHGAHHRGIGRW